MQWEMIQQLLCINVTGVLQYCNTELLPSLTLFCASTILPCTSARDGAGEEDPGTPGHLEQCWQCSLYHRMDSSWDMSWSGWVGTAPMNSPENTLNDFDIVVILPVHDTIFSVMLFSKIEIAACIMMYIITFSYELLVKFISEYHSLLIQPNFFVSVIYYHQCLYLIHEKLQRSLYDFSS